MGAIGHFLFMRKRCRARLQAELHASPIYLGHLAALLCALFEKRNKKMVQHVDVTAVLQSLMMMDGGMRKFGVSGVWTCDRAVTASHLASDQLSM